MPELRKGYDIRKGRMKDRFFLCAAPGAGKTNFGLTLPRSTLVIDMDNKVNSTIGLDDVYAYTVTAYEPGEWLKCKKMVREVCKEGVLGPPFLEEPVRIRTLIWDGLSSASSLAMLEAQRVNGNTGKLVPSLPDYGAQTNLMKEMLRIMLTFPGYLVVTAHEEMKVDELSGRIMALPLVTGKWAYMIGKDFGEYYNMTHEANKETGKIEYFVLTKPSKLHIQACTLHPEFEAREPADWRLMQEKIDKAEALRDIQREEVEEVEAVSHHDGDPS